MYPGVSRFWKSPPQRAVVSGYLQSHLASEQKGGEGEAYGRWWVKGVAYVLLSVTLSVALIGGLRPPPPGPSLLVTPPFWRWWVKEWTMHSTLGVRDIESPPSFRPPIGPPL